MKLNGKIYLKEDTVRNEIEDLIILLEQGDYRLIAESIKNIRPENAENVAIKLAQFQDMFIALYETENYCKLDDILEMANENLHDSKKETVSLFTSGAYGVIIASDKDASERYIFNICVYVFMKKIKNKYNEVDPT
jgi:hypothetical protein